MVTLPTVGQIVTLVGSFIGVFSLGWRIRQGHIDELKERINNKDDLIKTLRDNEKGPSEYKAKLDLAETINQKHVEALKSEIADAKKSGDVTLREKEAALAQLEELSDQIAVWQLAAKKYQTALKEAEKEKAALTLSLEGSSKRNFQELFEVVNGFVPPNVPTPMSGSFLGLLSGQCINCTTSVSKCSKCHKPYCMDHRPPRSIGERLQFLCGNCRPSELAESLAYRKPTE